MFGTIRKHQTWLWGVIITFTIVSFVVMFSPYARMNNSRERGPVDYGTIHGRKITETEFLNAYREVNLRYLITSGRWPDEQARQTIDRETLEWAFLSRRQELAGIHIDGERAADLAREMIRSLQRTGINSAPELAKVLESQGFSMGDFERFVHHYLGLQELVATVGVSGKFTTPGEIRGLYEREHQELVTQVLFFDATNFLAAVTVTPDAIQQFYTNELATYRIPERLQVSAVLIPITNYLAQAEALLAKTNLNDLVEVNYQRIGTNTFKDAKTPEEIKKRIREEIVREQASNFAHRAANDFARPLVDSPQPTVEAFNAAAKAHGLPVQVLEPFSRESAPKDLEGNEDFLKSVFTLGPENLISGAYRGRDAFYVMAFGKRIPSEIPPLETIRDRVVAGFRAEQAKNLARQNGFSFYTGLTNALAQGKSFDTLCAEAKLKPQSLPPFSISTRALPELSDQLSLNLLKQLAFSTTPGKVSGFQWTPEGGAIVFVKAKMPVDETRLKAEIVGYSGAVRQQRQQEAFQNWFQQEFSRNVRSAIIQQAPAQGAPAGAGRGARKS